MADKINANNLGMTLGGFFALLHAVWAILVGIGVAESLLDWIMPLHFIGTMFEVTGFTWGNAILLTILAFIGGYVSGWILAAIWNCKCMKK